MTRPGVRSTSCRTESIRWFDDPAIADAYPFFSQYPLRYVSVDAQGVETSRATTTKIERKRIDDARFVVPADYEKTDLAPLMEGLGRLFKEDVKEDVTSGHVSPPRHRRAVISTRRCVVAVPPRSQ